MVESSLRDVVRRRPLRFAAALGLIGTLAHCPLFAVMDEDRRAREEQEALQRRQAEEEALRRKQAEQEARRREIAEQLARLRVELQAERDVAKNALSFAHLVVELQAQSAPPFPGVAALADESAAYLVKSIQSARSLDAHAALFALLRTPAVDAAFASTCGRVRPLIQEANIEAFMDLCIERAGADAGKLSWPGIAGDREHHRRVKAQRFAEAERARVAAEESARAAEELRRQRAAAGICDSDSECGSAQICRDHRCAASMTGVREGTCATMQCPARAGDSPDKLMRG